MSVADFATPFHANQQQRDPVDSIPDSTKSKTWQDIEQGEVYSEDSQYRHFQTEQPKSTVHQHQYPTRSKAWIANEAKVKATAKPNFVCLRDKVEQTIPV